MRDSFAFWIALRTSLWFIPTVVVAGSMVVAYALVEAGAHISVLSQDALPQFFGFSAEGSRAMLSAIATSLITVAGVAFSITIVALSLTSSQYSPRVLRQFMRNRPNQWVLGVFVGVFAFCLTVLPRVRGGDENGFVPAVAVAASIVYALIGVGCLIYFIHHVARSIQASYIVSDIAAETRATAEQMFSKGMEQASDEPSPVPAGRWHMLHATGSGYIQLVKKSNLLRLATEHDLVIRMERAVGEFVVSGTPLVSFQGGIADERRLAADVAAAFTITDTRTVEQDVMFGIQQIVDVAVRALSPSVNDPTTAILCIDYITTILHLLAGRRMGNRALERDGRVRMLVCEPTFDSVVDRALGEVRANADRQLLVLGSLLRAIDTLTGVVNAPARRAALAREAAAIAELLSQCSPDPRMAPFRLRAHELVARLGSPPQSA